MLGQSPTSPEVRSNNETRDAAWQDTVSHNGTSGSAEQMAYLKRYHGYGFDAALASVPVPLTAGDAPDHTALIAEAVSWLRADDKFPRAEANDLIQRLAIALESQQGNTTSRSDQKEWVFLNPDGSEAFVLDSCNTAQIEAWTKNDTNAKVMHRTPPGPWIPVEKEQS